MTKRQGTFYGMAGLFLGIVSGIAGTAFAMGSERQSIKDSLITNVAAISTLASNHAAHKDAVEKEMDRYAEIIAAQITNLQINVQILTTTVGDLRTDVQVLKAIMERMENDSKRKVSSH